MADEPKINSFTVLVSQSELCVRIMEALVEQERPEGVTADEAMDLIEPEMRDDLARAAAAAMEYFAECVRKATRLPTNPD